MPFNALINALNPFNNHFQSCSNNNIHLIWIQQFIPRLHSKSEKKKIRSFSIFYSIFSNVFGRFLPNFQIRSRSQEQEEPFKDWIHVCICQCSPLTILHCLWSRFIDTSNMNIWHRISIWTPSLHWSLFMLQLVLITIESVHSRSSSRKLNYSVDKINITMPKVTPMKVSHFSFKIVSY